VTEFEFKCCWNPTIFGCTIYGWIWIWFCIKQ